VDTNTRESVLLATNCIEINPTGKNRPGILTVTRSRIIIFPIPDTIARKETLAPSPGEVPPAPATGSSWRSRLKGHPGTTHDSPIGAMVQEFRTKDVKEILEEKDAWEIPLDDIAGITFRRIRTTGKNSRLRSFILLPYPFEPASARYEVDYQLTLGTRGETYLFETPFLLELKQVLVDQIGDRVSETIDSNAPLL
jgi:hypothetical protein